MPDASEAGAAGAARVITERARWLLAPNPGPMTFEGTNSWVLAEPGGRGAVVVDPGPDDPAHLAALAAAARERGGEVEAILVTHRHVDHLQGAAALSRMTSAPVLAADPAAGDEVIGDGAVLAAGAMRIEVLATPGHSSDSLSFYLPAEHTLLTG